MRHRRPGVSGVSARRTLTRHPHRGTRPATPAGRATAGRPSRIAADRTRRDRKCGVAHTPDNRRRQPRPAMEWEGSAARDAPRRDRPPARPTALRTPPERQPARPPSGRRRPNCGCRRSCHGGGGSQGRDTASRRTVDDSFRGFPGVLPASSPVVAALEGSSVFHAHAVRSTKPLEPGSGRSPRSQALHRHWFLTPRVCAF
jgi:hypothetical protein